MCGQEERIIVQGTKVSQCRGKAVQSLLDVKKDSEGPVAPIWTPLCHLHVVLIYMVGTTQDTLPQTTLTWTQQPQTLVQFRTTQIKNLTSPYQLNGISNIKNFMISNPNILSNRCEIRTVQMFFT